MTSTRGLALDLAKKGVVYGLGASLNGLVAFLLLPFIVHRLDSFEYGRFALAELLLNLLLVICGLGLNSAMLARYAKLDETAQRDLIGSVIGLVVVATLCILAAFAAFAWLAGPYVFPELAPHHYALVAAIAICETVWFVIAAMYRARGDAWRYIALQLVQVLVALGLTIELIAHRGYREEGLLVGRLAADITVLVLLLPALVHYRPRSLRPAWDLMRIGGPLVLAAFSAILVAMSPRLLLEHFYDAGVVGSFVVDSRLASIVSIGFVQPFGLVYVAAIVPIAKRPDAGRVFARAAMLYIALGGLSTIALGLVAPWIAHTLGKQQFPISPAAILVLAAANIGAGLIYPLTIGPYVLERTREVIPVYVGAAVVAIAAGWIASAYAGILGAAVALVAVYLAQGIALAIVSQRMYPVPFQWGRIALLCAAFAGAVIAVVSVGPR